MKITVRQKHINMGIPKHPCRCPIGLAIMEQHFAVGLSVSARGILINELEYSIPTKAVKFILDFDLGKKVEPFEFETGEW